MAEEIWRSGVILGLLSVSVDLQAWAADLQDPDPGQCCILL